MDYNGHGTHVAGTIAAVGNNGLSVTGVCWTTKIMPLRGLNADGSGWTSDFISAIEYANAKGAHVINNSWGGGSYSQALKNAIDASSAVVVCAAGNDGVNNDITPHYPSNYTSTNIISVAATDQDDEIASFSNYGATSVDVGAPGTNIYSTMITRHDEFSDDCSSLGNWTTGGTSNWGVENGYLTESPGDNYDGWHIDDVKVTAFEPGVHNSYEFLDSTSMATPIVSGIAGLIKATTPLITNIEIKAAIEQNVDSIPALSVSGLTPVATGGRVNANNIFPAAPSTLTATAFSGTRIDLTWTDNSSNETGFRIERKTGVGGTYAEIGSVGEGIKTYSDTGLSASTEYFYRVISFNAGGDLATSNEANATTQAASSGGGGGGGGGGDCFISTAAFGL